MSYSLILQATAAGVELVGEAPPRIRISDELLADADPAVLAVDDQGDVTFTLANAALSYRRVGPVHDDRCVEFDRVA